jgi:long-chain acyl-CoA synthetase
MLPLASFIQQREKTGGNLARPFPWEACYPPGVSWDAAIMRGTLPGMLDHATSRFADCPALRFISTRWSYQQLSARVDRFAAALIAEGLRPGDRVGLLLPNTLTHPLSFFAVLKAGGVVVHLTPLDPPRTLARKVADVGARFVIAPDHPGLRAAAEALPVERLFISREAAWFDQGPLGLPDGEPLAAWPTITPNDLALLQFTGGTTGHPKAAMLSHGNLTAAVSIYTNWNTAQGRPLTPNDRVLCVLPLFHIYALTSVMLRSLANGAEVLLHGRFDPMAVLDAIERDRVTLLSGVPTMWTALARTPGIETRDLSSITGLFSGGAPLAVDIADRIEALTGFRVGGGWGMTETSPCGTNLLPGSKHVAGGIGVPLPGIECRIVDPEQPSRELPQGEIGELAIRGPNVTSGYWGQPEESARAFCEGFLLTGDLCQMQPDGSFVLVDRKKDMILSGGFNVYPRVIEEAICEHPDVAEAAVVGIDDEYRGQSAKAFVTLRPEAPNLSLADLRTFLADKLGRHELPTAMELRDILPKTAVGKLSRHALRDAAAE